MSNMIRTEIELELENDRLRKRVHELEAALAKVTQPRPARAKPAKDQPLFDNLRD